MNEQIVQYLTENKDHYTQASLVEQLRKAGHNEAAITQAVQTVYGEAQVPMPETPSLEMQVKYAGFWVRFAAVLIDLVVFLYISGVVLTLFHFMTDAQDALVGSLYRFVIYVLMILYYCIMTDKYQATVGKMALGIKVCDAHTLQKASSRTIIMREVIARIIQLIPTVNLVHIIIAFTQKKQGVHDMIAKTVVVHKDANKKKGFLTPVIILGVIFAAIVFVVIMSSIGFPSFI